MGHLVGKDVFRRLGEKLDGLEVKVPWDNRLHAILKELYTPEEADVVVKMPYGLSSLARLERATGLERPALERILDGLTAKGLVIDLWTGDAYRYVPSPYVIGIFEFTMMRAGRDANPKTWAKLFHEYFGTFLQANLAKGDRYTTFRTLPFEEAIASAEHAEVLDHDKASAIIAEADRFAIGLCSCRHEKHHLGRKRCDVPLETCTQFGYAADFGIRHGLAREVSRSEMQDSFARSREMGLVMVADNVRTGMRFVCHCCSCCCNVLGAINEFGYPNVLVTSSYLAEIDPSACSDCQDCIAACPVHAIATPPPRRDAGALAASDGKPRVDASRCLGCGVCALQCTTGACTLKRRGQRIIPPESTFERLLLQCLEKGNLQNLMFDDPGRIDHKFMRAFVGGFLRLPTVKQALLGETLRSRFLDAMRRGVRAGGKGAALPM